MIKRLFLFLFAFANIIAAYAQGVIPQDTAAHRTSGLRISLLTCGAGYSEVWEVFGHTGVRVIDSNERGEMRDVVFNYGMFNGFDENFEINFMRGKLLYFVGVNLFSDFMEEYRLSGRKVEEQVLQLDGEDLEQIQAMLDENAQPENMYYKYDFFFDNCATRIRDIFPRALGKGFVYTEIRPQTYKPTFREIINRYFYSKHWVRVGVNVLLGSRIDKVMTNADIMFLPDYLRDGMGGAMLDGKPVAAPTSVLLNGNPAPDAGVNVPLLLMWAILLLTIAGLFVNKLRVLGRVMSTIVLLVSGLLGCIILVMWFGTNHQGCGNNYNILWALPINVFIAFAKPRGKGLYALVAMLLILVSLLLHVLHVQGLVPEFLPLLLSLLLIHGVAYRNSKNMDK